MTRCCASTSMGRDSGVRGSTSPRAMASRTATISSSCNACVGTHRTWAVAPGRWADRPARCNILAIPLGDPTCTTRSTGARSTPRSSDDVHTTSLNSPDFRPSSTRTRSSPSMLPWCSPIHSNHSGLSWTIDWYQISACARVLQNTRVGRSKSIHSTSAGASRVPKCPLYGNSNPGGSASVCRSSGRSMLARTTLADCPSPATACAASSALARVADSAHVRSPGENRRRRAKHNSTCVPRLLSMMSCHSSTTTSPTPPSSPLASGRLKSSDNDSGVVISTSGRRFCCRARTLDEVSPVRVSTSTGRPRSRAGRRRAFSRSRAMARSGEM